MHLANLLLADGQLEAAVTEFDVLVVGDANPDLLLRGDVRPRFGQAEQLLTAADLVLPRMREFISRIS